MDSKAEKIQAKFNEQIKAASEPQPGTSGYNRGNRNSKGYNSKKEDSPSGKQLKWDKTILQTLVGNCFRS